MEEGGHSHNDVSHRFSRSVKTSSDQDQAYTFTFLKLLSLRSKRLESPSKSLKKIAVKDLFALDLIAAAAAASKGPLQHF